MAELLEIAQSEGFCFEVYPTLILDLYALITLHRRENILKQAGHSRHKDYPKSAMIKQGLLFLWLLTTVFFIMIVMVGYFDSEFIWLM